MSAGYVAVTGAIARALALAAIAFLVLLVIGVW